MIEKLILFDIDGTLLHSRGVGREAKRLAMVDVFGTIGDVDEIRFGGKTDWGILYEALKNHGYSREAIGQQMETYSHAIAKHMDRLIGQFPVHALPAALELVADLRQREHYMLGIITGNVYTTAPIKLRAGGFDPEWFQVGAYGNESADRNDLSRFAWERANQHRGEPLAVENIYVIGDTAVDVLCAKAIGAHSIAVRTGFAEIGELEACEPTHLYDDLQQFMAQRII